MRLPTLLTLTIFLSAAHGTSTHDTYVASTSNHTNNWAVLVSSSRYWFNYRHMANALGMYRTVKRLGIPDSNIILMLADDAACDARNAYPGKVYAGAEHSLDLYGDNIEVDYRGREVTVEALIRLLTGRVAADVPRAKRLLTDERSNVFVYMAGHGGDGFLKFQDNEELSADGLADAFETMRQMKRYNELFFMIDSCQATTMYSKIYSPNILATASSQLKENSLAYELDYDIGVHIIDSYTRFVLEFLEGVNKTSHATLGDLFASYDPKPIRSVPGVRSDLFVRPLDAVRVTDFFGGITRAEVVEDGERPPLPYGIDYAAPASTSPRAQDEATHEPSPPTHRKSTFSPVTLATGLVALAALGISATWTS